MRDETGTERVRTRPDGIELTGASDQAPPLDLLQSLRGNNIP